MERVAFQNRFSEKEPQATSPRASSPDASDGHPMQGHNARSSASEQRGTFTGNVQPLLPGSVLREKPRKTSEATLPQIGRQDLIREVQGIVLQFSTKEMAQYQDSTERAVESQRNGESAMSLLAAANASRTNPRVRAMFARLFGITGPMADADFAEGYDRMMDFFIRQQANLVRPQPRSREDWETSEGMAGEACDGAMVDMFGDAH